ncbi:hypothetical protein JW613_09395 [Streptomyces smyrnaeus]|uniref:Secreted protein n=1 Tax=Streptomyces smyrnaeus TaxID=1387713 RepID=A0ABS3XT31_9ACTN|nr:hypothetical protein [Streptomyces smyrnaeus]MBO8198519.1 hypothetical protein [Streptomyces smyrnaeus]
MQRSASILGALAAAAALAVTVPASANAANGYLLIDGKRYVDPSGCYELPQDAEVENHTDQPADVYSDGNCEGQVMETIPAGGSSFTDWGYSLRIE